MAFGLAPTHQDGLATYCRPCDAERAREYGDLHREEKRARNKAWAAAHVAERQAYCAAYHVAHQKQIKAASAAWNAANSDKRRASAVRWRAANPEKERTHHSRRGAATRGAAVIENVDVRVLAARDHDRCGVCKRLVEVGERSIDHILPISLGGEHSYANTRLAHRRCNTGRGNRGAAQLRMIG